MEQSKKNNVEFLVYVIMALIAMSLFAYFVTLFQFKFAIVYGFVLMLLSIPFVFLGKKDNRLYTVCYCLNSLASGLSIGSLYAIQNWSLPLMQVLVVTLGVSVFVSLMFLWIQKMEMKGAVKVGTIALVVFIMVLLVVAMLFDITESYYSFTFLLMIHAAIYSIFLGRTKRVSNPYYHLALFSFGIYIVVTLVVVTIITEGDFGLDFLPENNKKKNKGIQ